MSISRGIADDSLLNDDKNYRLMSCDNNFSAAYLNISTDSIIYYRERLCEDNVLNFFSVGSRNLVQFNDQL